MNLGITSVDLSSDHLMMTHELLAAGYDERALARMVRDKSLQRIRHGAYVVAEYWQSLDKVQQRKLVALATLRSARSPAVLAGPSAADVFGAPVWDMGDEVHLARLDRKAGRRKCGKVQHRGQLFSEDDGTQRATAHERHPHGARHDRHDRCSASPGHSERAAAPG